MHVLIVGAGLGGLSLAQNLRKRGISFEIFERDPEANARSQGWAIALYSIVSALVESYPSDMPDMRDSVNHLTPLQLPAQVTVYTPGKEGRFGYQWGKHTDNVAYDDKGVTLSFKDGTRAHGDIVVGADGINSIVREKLINRHSGIMCIRPDLGFVSFVGLHFVHPDGLSARYYWNLMEYDSDVAKPDHWLQTASKEEKLDRALKITEKLPPKLREIFELTKTEQIREEQHVWRDLELESLPAGRVVLMGDAAHAMMPIRGEGGYHTLVDSLVLGKTLGQLAEGDKFKDPAAVELIVTEYDNSLIQRGLQAVRDLRRLDLNATRYGPDGKPLSEKEVPTIKPLPDMKIVLGVAP